MALGKVPGHNRGFAEAKDTSKPSKGSKNMPSGPRYARISHATARTISINDALYSRAINEQRRPAPMPKYCTHGHAALQCSECIRAHEDLLGLSARKVD
ncbi:MAG TPA: hypothetical protein VHT25_10290 [Solirubrobacteraceae bacterium]|nr:hypothetical protein [Solirubrobacteraceae bacterium]